MKKLVKILPLLLAVLFTTNSCIVDLDKDDVWDDGNEYYDNDDALYNYVRTGNWYPSSPSGLTECEYNSYMVFSGLYVYMYDCNNNRYDSGTFDIRNGYLTITYVNGDTERYSIEKSSNGQLDLKTTTDGILYQYVRN